MAWLQLSRSKYYDWCERYGKANEHNALVPRDYWLSDFERDKIIEFYEQNPLNGYRRLTFMMLDQNIVYVSPTTVYNVLREAGLIDTKKTKASKKGSGFQQPVAAHLHWHIDVSYINVGGTFYYLCSVLDGYSRYLVHWDLKPSMTEAEVELILERAREKFPGHSPRVISDNGPVFIAKDFKEYIRLCGMTHVRTAPFYPQSNGKIERWHGALKKECIRRAEPSNYNEACEAVRVFVDDYNNVRLHSALGYIAPKDQIEGRAQEIFEARDRKLAAARETRRVSRMNAAAVNASPEQLNAVRGII